MPRIFEVKHGPKFSIRIRLADLIQRRIILIHDFVNRAHYARILDRPLEISGRFAPYDVLRAFAVSVG